MPVPPEGAALTLPAASLQGCCPLPARPAALSAADPQPSPPAVASLLPGLQDRTSTGQQIPCVCSFPCTSIMHDEKSRGTAGVFRSMLAVHMQDYLSFEVLAHGCHLRDHDCLATARGRTPRRTRPPPPAAARRPAARPAHPPAAPAAPRAVEVPLAGRRQGAHRRALRMRAPGTAAHLPAGARIRSGGRTRCKGCGCSAQPECWHIRPMRQSSKAPPFFFQ
jgi:hypothetical protein